MSKLGGGLVGEWVVAQEIFVIQRCIQRCIQRDAPWSLMESGCHGWLLGICFWVKAVERVGVRS